MLFHATIGLVRRMWAPTQLTAALALAYKGSMRIALLVVMGVFLVAACGKDKKEEATKELAEICERSTEALKGDPGDAFMQYLENALKSCSAACDGKHEASCKSLEEHFGIVCGVSPDICKNLCSSADSPSLKKYACAAAGS